MQSSHRFERGAARLAECLRAYALDYPDENATVERFLRLLDDGEPAFRRTHPGGHFTASALVFGDAGRQVLLTHHRKLDIWVQLGGHADGQADLPAAALREAQEESGLTEIDLVMPRIVDLDIHAIPAHAGEPAHDHYDVRYAFTTRTDLALTVSEESHDLAWVAVSRLDRFSREESLHRAVRKGVRVVTRLVR